MLAEVAHRRQEVEHKSDYVFNFSLVYYIHLYVYICVCNVDWAMLSK